MKKLQLSYYPDITQYSTQEAIRKSVVEFSQFLSNDYSDRLNQQIEIDVLPVMDVKSQTELMQNSPAVRHVSAAPPLFDMLAQRMSNCR